MFGNMNGSSTSPMGIASTVMGLPRAANKSTRRGRKPSGKPGASHLAALQQAHGAGNFPAARTHALNYAKATMGAAPSQNAGSPDPDGMDEANESNGAPPLAAPSMTAAPSPNPRAMLAKLAMRRAGK